MIVCLFLMTLGQNNPNLVCMRTVYPMTALRLIILLIFSSTYAEVCPFHDKFRYFDYIVLLFEKAQLLLV